MRRALLLLALLAACGGDDDPGPQPGGPDGPDGPAAAATSTEPAVVATAFGSLEVEWTASPGPIPLNETFEVRARVVEPGPEGAVAEGVSLVVDAGMPAHMHGMVRVPEISRDGDEWVARGMQFHMLGRWELTFDVERDGVTERAVAEVVLD